MAIRLHYVGMVGFLFVALGPSEAAETGSSAHPQFIEQSTSAASVDPDVGALQQVAFHRPSTSLAANDCAVTPPWAHRTGLFGELLFLRARDAEVAYARPVNGNVPEGPLGILDPELDLGYRVGLTKAFDDCRSLNLAYTGFFSEQSDRIGVDPPRSLSKILVHPNEANAATNVPAASGVYEIDFQIADLEYRFLALANDCTALNFFVGGRYGRLDQELTAAYAGAGLTETVTSDIEFNGAGIRLGADLETHSRHGLFFYGKTSANLLAGEFEADYLHSSNVDPVRVSTSWEAGRIVSILDLEMGAGWQCTSNCRISAGYTFSNWSGVVKTDEWLSRVRNDNVRDMSDNLTFDGLVTRFEYRF